MRDSVKYAKMSCTRKKMERAILEFSTKLVETAMPEEPSYATAFKIAEALKDLGSALEVCYEDRKAGLGFQYVLELHICKDTVSHQLTRDGNAAEGQLPSLHTVPCILICLLPVQAIIKVALSICYHGARVNACMDGMR